MNRFSRWLLILGGTVFMGVGILGIFLPLLPTTPFLLLAAYLYSRSSERFYRWLIGNRLLGGYIRRYRDGRSMTRWHKALTLAFLWLGIGLSIAFVGPDLWARLLLGVVAVGVTAHIVMLKAAD